MNQNILIGIIKHGTNEYPKINYIINYGNYFSINNMEETDKRLPQKVMPGLVIQFMN